MQHTADRVSAIIKRFSGMAFTKKECRETDLAVLESMPHVSASDALVDFRHCCTD